MAEAMKKEFLEFKSTLPAYGSATGTEQNNDIEVTDEKLEELRSLGYVK